MSRELRKAFRAGVNWAWGETRHRATRSTQADVEALRLYPDTPPEAHAEADPWANLLVVQLRIALQDLYDATPDCEGGALGKACLQARNTLSAIPARPAPADALRAALEYYADPETWRSDDDGIRSATEDEGEIARTTLAAPPEAHAEAEDVKALVWIRKKLGLPEDAQMFSGSDTIAGKLHNLCFDAVRAELAEDRIKELEARAPAAIPEGLRAVLEKARVLIVNMDKWNTDVEKIVGRVPNTGFERAGDLVAEIDAALALGKP